jgi:hypothetical protein
MRIGVPAARIGKNRTCDIIVRVTPGKLELYVDGVIVDEDYPMGKIPASPELRGALPGFDGEVQHLELLPYALSNTEIINRCGGTEQVAARTMEILGPERTNMQYYTPRGHNQWIGDVMTGDIRTFDPERLHLFFYEDRGHCFGRFSEFSPRFAHISTADLKTWRHHPIALDADEWNEFGTGRPFIHDGKIILAYGMHNYRLYGENSITVLEADAEGRHYPKEFPADGRFPEGTPDAGRYPKGTTFAESADGITFKKSNILVHECENPNIVRAESGNEYLMLAGATMGSSGLWTSSDLLHWKLQDPDIIPYFTWSPVHNSNECQCMFEWNGRHYIIGGRNGFWMSNKQTGPYWPGLNGQNVGVITPRWDIYDGLMVPMVAEFKDNRRILAGFLIGVGGGWGGHLVFRELMQMPDGTLGMKWPEEMRPEIRRKLIPEIECAGKTVCNDEISLSSENGYQANIVNIPQSLHLSLRVKPDVGAAHLAITGLGKNGGGCTLSFLVNEKRVQWCTSKDAILPEKIPSMAELVAGDEQGSSWSGYFNKDQHAHWLGRDFTITDVDGINKPFELELVFTYDPKIEGTIIDAFIAGHRTMITRRKGLVINKLRFMADGPARFEKISLGEI